MTHNSWEGYCRQNSNSTTPTANNRNGDVLCSRKFLPGFNVQNYGQPQPAGVPLHPDMPGQDRNVGVPAVPDSSNQDPYKGYVFDLHSFDFNVVPDQAGLILGCGIAVPRSGTVL